MENIFSLENEHRHLQRASVAAASSWVESVPVFMPLLCCGALSQWGSESGPGCRRPDQASESPAQGPALAMRVQLGETSKAPPQAAQGPIAQDSGGQYRGPRSVTRTWILPDLPQMAQRIHRTAFYRPVAPTATFSYRRRRKLSHLLLTCFWGRRSDRAAVAVVAMTAWPSCRLVPRSGSSGAGVRPV